MPNLNGHRSWRWAKGANMGDRERPLVCQPALVCPNPECGAWDSRDDGKRWLKVTWTDRIGDTRQQKAVCRKCHLEFDIQVSPAFRSVTVG